MGFFDFLRDEEDKPVDQPLPTALAKPVEEASPQSGGAIENPQVREYIQKLYGDKFNDSARTKLQDQIKQESSGPNWMAGLAALGNGLQGGNALDAGMKFKSGQQAERDKKLTDFDASRKALVGDQELGMKLRNDAKNQETLARESDPNSEESKIAQQAALKLGVNPEIVSKLTAKSFKAQGPVFEKIYAADQAVLKRQDDRNFQKEMFGLKRDDINNQRQVKLDEKNESLQTPYGLANTADDAKQLKEASESKKNFDNKINEMIALREKHGGGATLNREDVARGKQLSKDLLLEYKNMAKLGVLSQSDEKIINAIIPEDPLAYNSPIAAVQGQDPILANLKAFQNDSTKDFSNRVATRTREGIKGNQSKVGSSSETKIVGGKTYKKVPGGWQLLKDGAVADVTGGRPGG